MAKLLLFYFQVTNSDLKNKKLYFDLLTRNLNSCFSAFELPTAKLKRQNLDLELPKSSKTFETYINKVNVIMDSQPLSINELKDTFFSLKVNKRSVVDDISSNMLWGALQTLNLPIIYL